MQAEKHKPEQSLIKPSSVLYEAERSYSMCLRTPGLRLRYGLPCPYCQDGEVDYNSTLTLYCKKCGKQQSGAYT